MSHTLSVNSARRVDAGSVVGRRRRALIIGAGVAGPVTAMALERAGIEGVVFEAHPQPTEEVGSFLTVATNGMNALQAIGAAPSVAVVAFATNSTVLLSGTGKRLGAVSLGATGPRAIPSHTLKRAHLHRALHDEAARRGVRVEFGKRLLEIEDSAHGVVARFDDGSEADGDFIVGCDGVHSTVRRAIDPAAPAPRYVGLLNFGGYTHGASPGQRGVWYMIFGRRAFFGYVTDPQGGTAWFANLPRAQSTVVERASTTADQWRQQLIDLFADDVGPAVDLIARGELQLAADNTHDLPSVPRWYKGRAIIIGDAAHAPSPSSGQGASMAIEDGVVLAQCLRDTTTHQAAFEAFERLRRPRVERIVAQGARSSSSKAVGPVGRALRDLLLPFVFRHLVTERSLAWIYDYPLEWTSQVETTTSEGRPAR